jgi:tellurite resistance protein TerC
MIKEKDKEIHPEKNVVIKAFRKIFPVTTKYDNGRFVTKIEGKWFATPLLIVLLMIESSDVIFAVDSIPAVLAVSQDTFVVYTSNIMAILGLRALYFAISSIMQYFKYLNYGLAVILAYVGIKMLVAHYIHIPSYVSLIIVFSILIVTMVLSVMIKKREPETEKVLDA